jgi:hypothetical protein
VPISELGGNIGLALGCGCGIESDKSRSAASVVLCLVDYFWMKHWKNELSQLIVSEMMEKKRMNTDSGRCTSLLLFWVKSLVIRGSNWRNEINQSKFKAW